LTIRNTGNAAAHDVDACWALNVPDADKKEWEIETIPPGGRHQFRIPFPDEGKTDVEDIKQDLSGNTCELEFEADCTNILGSPREFCDTVEIQDALGRTADADEIILPEELEEIKNVIVELTDTLERLSEKE
jgi:hypothetical protein